VLAIVAPGQGAQKPGFLLPWLSDWDGAQLATARLRWMSALSGLDLVHLGTEADADAIKDTATTQPLLTAAALMAAAALPVADAAVVAGHSVGELSAAAMAGVLSTETAVALAGVRGREMAAACEAEATGMTALLGGEEDDVLAAIEAAGLTPANRNGAGQIVAAGSLAGLEKLAAAPPEKARVRSLAVAGAFHTHYMAPAREALEALAGGITPAEPKRLLLSNADGTTVTTGAETLNRLVRQVTSPVRWDLCMAALAELGVTALIELPPAGTLAGLAKRALKGIELVTVNAPKDLPAAFDLAARHGSSTDAQHAESDVRFHVAVAPAAGQFVQGDLTEGDPVAAGQRVGSIDTRQGPVEVASHRAGVLVEWLAHDGDPVAAGTPLARLNPAGA
jgi:[acyl-carrier-protein] S-malonyltransferase